MITIEPLNVDNWLKVCELSVSNEQKEIFPIDNVYWIGISRYEEHTELFAIKYNDDYVGMIGCGYDEDGVSGYINPLMIDKNHQGNGYAKHALSLVIKYLIEHLNVTRINISHRLQNTKAGILYASLGFKKYEEKDRDIYLKLEVSS